MKQRIFWALTVSNNSCKEETLLSISVLPRYSGYIQGAHELLLVHSHSENILVDLVDSTDMNG